MTKVTSVLRLHYKRNVKIGLATGREITEAEKTLNFVKNV